MLSSPNRPTLAVSQTRWSPLTVDEHDSFASLKLIPTDLVRYFRGVSILGPSVYCTIDRGSDVHVKSLLEQTSQCRLPLHSEYVTRTVLCWISWVLVAVDVFVLLESGPLRDLQIGN